MIQAATDERCEQLRQRLANGLHVSDYDVHCLLARIALLNAEKADARRAALEQLSSKLVVRCEGHRARTTGGFPEAQAVRMTLDDVVDIIDDEYRTLLDSAPKETT